MTKTPLIPDFELLRLIGRGSYGDVWLARGITGGFRAIKVVWRDHFERQKSFEREFEGIRRLEPVSRRNPGLVDLLHVGRNAWQEFYYYVMELADDVAAGAGEVNPVEYTPRTLSTDMATRDPAVLRVFLDHGRKICEALHHLHENGLAHRDVKPSNIIFVDGIPKLADIGLVAATGQRTYVGTEGYIPPEGPGTPAADVYSLGMVLYEVMTGNDRLDFPELPEEKNPIVDAANWRALNEIVCRACAPAPNKRYASAQAFGKALDALSAPAPARSKWKLAGLGLAAVAAAALFLSFFWKGDDGPVSAPAPGPVPPLPSPAAAEATGNSGNSASEITSTAVTPSGESEGPAGTNTGTGAMIAAGGTAVESDASTGGADTSAAAGPDKTTGVAAVAAATPDANRFPRPSEPWSNSLGMKFLPREKVHITAEPTETRLFDRFIDETNRALEGEVITLGSPGGGPYRHIIAVPHEDALAFCDWVREKDLAGGVIGDDYHYRVKPHDQFTSRNANGEIVQLAFHCVVEKQEYGSLEITTDPPGATVYAGEEAIGKTPLREPRHKAGPINYLVSLEGFRKIFVADELPADETLQLHFDLVESAALVPGKPWENSLKMRFVPLGGGDIMISVWETRKMDFDAFVAETGREPHHESDLDQDGFHPVIKVNRNDAMEFCEWLTVHEQRAGLLEADQEYRLPSDLEWSEAAGLPRERGADPASRNQSIKGMYPWGYIFPPEQAVGNFADRTHARKLSGATIGSYNDGFAWTAPAGSFPPNKLGIFDLAGNVWEWIAEPFGGPYERTQNHGVVRGGCWSNSEKENLLTTCRNAIPADLREPIYGFRCAIAKRKD